MANQDLKPFERPLDRIIPIADWSSTIQDVELIQDEFTHETALYVSLTSSLPDLFAPNDERFKKVFLYFKNSRHKGVWRIKEVFSSRKELICENRERSDGTRCTWELDAEIAVDPRIFEKKNQKNIEDSMSIGYIEDRHVVVVKREEVDESLPEIVRLTPPLLIGCRATILSISCISLVDQSFIADVQCVFTIRDVGKILKSEADDRCNALRAQTEIFDIEKAVKEFTSYYELERLVGFRHCRDKLDEEESKHVSLGEPDAEMNPRYNYSFIYRRNAVYNSSFNLRMYPFDEQIIKIAVIFNLDQYSAKLTENLRSRSLFLYQNFHLDDIFNVVNQQQVDTEISFSNPAFSSVNSSYSVVQYGVTLRRKHSYFIGNFILPIMMITGLSLTSFDVEGLEGRLQVTSSLWLTIVTYKLMLIDILPPISYFTFLNYYVIFCFFYIALVAIFNLYPEEESVRKRTEQVERNGLAVFFILAHLSGFLYLHVFVFRLRRWADRRMKVYEAKIKDLLQTLRDARLRPVRTAVHAVMAAQRWEKAAGITSTRQRLAEAVAARLENGTDPPPKSSSSKPKFELPFDRYLNASHISDIQDAGLVNFRIRQRFASAPQSSVSNNSSDEPSSRTRKRKATSSADSSRRGGGNYGMK